MSPLADTPNSQIPSPWRATMFLNRLAGRFLVGTSLLVTLPMIPVRAATVAFVESYAQTFDGLNQSGAQTLTGQGPHAFAALTSGSLTPAITGMEGWYLANPGGSSGNTEYRAQDGSLSGSAGRGVVSFGLTGSSNRALGALPTSNQINSFGVVLENTSAVTIPGITVAFTGQQWRAGDAGIFNTLSFAYGLGGSISDATTSFAALDFTSPNTTGGNAAIDGTLAANQVQRSATISVLDWTPGTSLALRWTMNEVTGQDTGLAIDNLQINAVPEPSAVVLGAAGIVLAGVAVRRRLRRTSARA